MSVIEFNDFLSHAVTPRNATVNIVHGDCIEKLTQISPQSVDLVLTDPPYFLDGLDNGWKKGDKVPTATQNKTGSVGGLPIGMAFNPKNGLELQKFMHECGLLLIEAMKPGAFALFFSQPRLSHRMAVGIEDAGFEIRDLLAWRFTKRAQFKAFTMDHFVEKMDIPKPEKEQIKSSMGGRKTPQLRPQFEAVILAQKPRDGTFINNWINYQTGLINTSATLDGKVPSTVMTVEKPAEKHGHLTPKPVLLFEHLIKLFSKEGQMVLDPFLGTGTTAVAAARCGRSCIGIEINKNYIETAQNRMTEILKND